MTLGLLVFSVEEWKFWLVLSLVGVIFSLLVWRAIKREVKNALIIRIILLFLSLASLALLALNPACLVPTKSRPGILLTDNFAKDVLDSLTRNKPAALVFSLDKLPSKQVEYLPDMVYLKINYPQLDSLTILGDGLPAYALAGLEGIHVDFKLNSAPEGIISLYYNPQLFVQDSLIVSGTYNHLSGDSVRVFLKGPEGGLDSVEISDEHRVAFRLASKVTLPGKYMYTIKILSADGNLVVEKLPLVVEPQEKLKILMLGSFPNFESRYLKNWLGENQHQVAIRNTISKRIYQYEYLNQEAFPIPGLNGRILDSQDLLIADQQAVLNLSMAEKNALESAIRENGLGILVQGGENPVLLQNTMDLFNFNLSINGRETVQWPWGENNGQQVNLSKSPFQINRGLGIIPLAEGEGAENILVAARFAGEGMTGLSLVTQTYPLILQGKQEAYVYFWTRILGQLARKKSQSVWHLPKNVVPLPDELLILHYFTDEVSPEGRFVQAEEDTIPFYLAQDVLMPEKWQGKIWPASPGWHQISSDKETKAHDFFVFDTSDWQNLRKAWKLKANLHWQQAYNLREFESNINQSYDEKLIERLWFYLVFLFSTAGLWLEQKLI